MSLPDTLIDRFKRDLNLYAQRLELIAAAISAGTLLSHEDREAASAALVVCAQNLRAAELSTS